MVSTQQYGAVSAGLVELRLTSTLPRNRMSTCGDTKMAGTAWMTDPMDAIVIALICGWALLVLYLVMEE